MAFTRSLRTDFSRSRSGGQYDLDDLSPRPDDALLPDEHERDAGLLSTASNRNSTTTTASYTDRSDSSRRGSQASILSDGSGTSSNLRGKGKAVASAYPDSRRSARGASGGRFSRLRGPDLWRPPFASPTREDPPSTYAYPSFSGKSSWIGSILHSRSNFDDDDISYSRAVPQRVQQQQQQQRQASPRPPPSEVDSSFTILRRREHEITRQIQYYLSEHEKAHENSPMGQMASGNTASQGQADSPSDSEMSAQGHVVPVRQPKKAPISLRRARNGITNSISMMADLKSEEDAQVAEAVALRKKALTKLQGIQSRMSSIDQDLGVMQDTATNPTRKKLREKKEKYDTVCNDIKALEERLRQAKMDKAIMERQMEELQSKLDSDVSGYQGAKRECEEGLRDLMRHPGVPALDVQDLGFKDWHEIGFKFLEQPRSKRRPDMAKEWWEGDLRYLEEYRDKLQADRAGLEEGGQLWLDAVAKIIGYEQRLSKALGMDTEASMSSSKWDKEQSDPKTLLLDFYRQMQETIRDLEATLKYAEAQGMTLLVAAVGAEVVAMENGKDVFEGLLKSQGWEIPKEPSGSSTPTTNADTTRTKETDTISTNVNAGTQEGDSSQVPTQYHDADEELSVSVIRRWETPTSSTTPASQSPLAGSLRASRAQLLGKSQRGKSVPTAASDAEAGAGKKAESTTGSSSSLPLQQRQHSNSPRLRGDGERAGESKSQPPPPPTTAARSGRESSSDHEEDDSNEVPAGLLSEIGHDERRHDDDDDDDDDGDDHDDNAVPKEFLSMHE